MRWVSVSIAVFMIGILAIAEPPKTDDAPKADDHEKVNKAIMDLKTLDGLCRGYKLKFDDYPDKLEQFLKPPRGRPILDDKDQLLDPWGTKYEYDAKGPKNQGKKPDIWCVTPSGKKIGNWPEPKK